ncbi:EexN family lipoprotein [Vibrio sp. SS-MA-C1-2]|uniref:EexN family lipoprotein n=1 Tax=Vibrio sp. SS-MA-C1-2 TaxID=2908646 RepID=UPI001F379238|nr:EexN family lipoprotein [Vibrio sp. SS-MA-C1-2]UJF17254.1 EexN family lipoprotein [Vibrio sp. SS-MA-C1-2]
MKKVMMFGVVTLTIGLIGCGEPDYEIEYYKTHEKERLEKLSWCNEIRKRRSTYNCKSAIGAEAQLSTEKLLGF